MRTKQHSSNNPGEAIMGTSNLLITLGTFVVASKSIMTIVSGNPVTDGLYALGYGFIALGLFSRLLKWSQEENRARTEATENGKIKVEAFYN